jgi:hypothetical protein
MRHLTLLLVLFAGLAQAGDFAVRAKNGKTVLATAEGQKYEASWGAVIAAAMRACVPPGSTSPANLGRFTFVGDVSSTGVVSGVEVQPSTVVSRCFGEHFSKAQLPPPPSSLLKERHSLLPVADDIEVQP